MHTLKIYNNKARVHVLETPAEIDGYFKRMYDKGDDLALIIDWETTGLQYNATPLLLSMCRKGEDPAIIANNEFFSRGIELSDLIGYCNKWFKHFNLIAHNAKYDSMINKVQGIKDENCKWLADTLVMVHLYDPNLEKKLETRVKADFKYEKQTFEERLRSFYEEKTGKKRVTGCKWSDIDWYKQGDELFDILSEYAGEDTYWETRLYYRYKDMLDEDAWRIHDRIEIPMMKILRDAKIRGVRIDRPLLREFEDTARKRMDKCIEEIYDECGCVFNLNSPKQKKQVLIDKMGLPVVSITKSGQPSTDSDTYEAWAEMGYKVGKLLNEFSELGKLMSGYLLAIPRFLDENNVLRGDLNSCGTKTGRCSSSDPNLQNMPNNHDFPVRASFIPRQGYVFINYDYSQLELRVMAHMSHDKKFMEIFLSGGDPHGEVAKACGITRKQAKVMNFGVLYGMGTDKYERTFGVTRKKAEEMIDNYHKVYSGFARWKKGTELYAEQNGYVGNLFGRIRKLPFANKKKTNFAAYAGDMRRSVNTIIQGTGADIVKLATIAMCNEFEKRGLDAHFLLQVHDEVLIEAREDQMREIERVVIDCMEQTTILNVPLIADGKILLNWGEMKDDSILSYPDRFNYPLLSGIL